MNSHAALVEQLKGDILAGTLERGVPLRQQELSERYQVSRIPVRDAIATLRNQGWLVAHGKAGVMVPTLHWQEAEDLYQMRALLECRLLEHALGHINYEIIGRARDINASLYSPSLTLLERGRLNWEVHASLYRAAQRPTLFNTVATLNEQVRRYMGFQYGPLDYLDTSQQEHEQLFDLLERKEWSQAVTLLQRHIEVAGVQLVEYLKTTEELRK
ncbi:GntR family transcriptional regulator [Marinomonas ostreistagni]|uniref:GntR family transcriptional regulator n=1 Tax=Marinomonas ostreistagni TaxID=359209 RepID=UPI00194ED11F|nr:GntR family transcriptional regulator [Marinomonas ostreistagni]MBM6550268.1 GntR family transcriptional regulator [Marinomonas ostreistagni]